MAGNLEALRAEVARHTGPAKARPLVALGQALANEYWRAGPGQPGAKPYLDEAIPAFREAYPLLEAGTFMRGQAAGQLGLLLGISHLTHGGPEEHREEGIPLLEEALSFPEQPAVVAGMDRMVLGQLFISRPTGRMRSPDALMGMMGTGVSAAEMADLDRGAEHFRQVAEGRSTVLELRDMARTMLEMTEAMRAMFGSLGGGPGGLDFNRMMQAIPLMQKVQQSAMRPPGAGLGGLPNIFEADRLAAMDPIDRPVIVVDQPEATPERAQPEATPAPPRATPVRVPAAKLREELFKTLPGASFGALQGLVDGDPAALGGDDIDRIAGLAGALDDAPDALGTDHLLFAVTLYLRSRVDSGGWGSEDDGANDVHAAGEALLAASDALVAEQADAVGLAFRLATLLDRRRPAADVRGRLAAGFGTVAEALRRVGADALVYPTASELLLLSGGSGRFSSAAPGSQLPPRVIVAGHNAVPGDVTASYVRSGAQLITLANRARRPLSEAAVFVASPRGDRRQAVLDALYLRRTFYPRSTGLGETVENVDGSGTADEVMAALTGSMLHLGCGVTADGGLELAGSAVLSAAEIAAGEPGANGGLAVLPPVATGGLELSDALLATQFADTIGFSAATPDEDLTSLSYFLLHTHLVDDRFAPADAVQAVHRWFADPDRKPPDHLPAAYAALAAADLSDPAYQCLLRHCGV